MKRAYLATLTITLLTATSVYAIDCKTIPSCAELGYTDKVSSCSGDSIKCPFDTSAGKCLSAGAVVGQIGYFATKPSSNKWLLCDGRFYHKDAYPELYAVIQNKFGGGGNIFAVPPYARTQTFLRPAETSSSTHSDGCLPNIKGTFTSDRTETSGAITYSTTKRKDYAEGGDGEGWNLTFDASIYNPIYSNICDYPTPNYYDVATYIYAGKPGNTSLKASSAKSGCATGYYYYTDGTCSSSYTSSKTPKGIVLSVYTSEIQYVFGGNNSVQSFDLAYSACRRSNPYASMFSYYSYSKIPASVSGSALAAVNTSRSYWASDNTVVTCLSRTECTQTKTATPGTYAYYYCLGVDKFDAK